MPKDSGFSDSYKPTKLRVLLFFSLLCLAFAAFVGLFTPLTVVFSLIYMILLIPEIVYVIISMGLNAYPSWASTLVLIIQIPYLYFLAVKIEQLAPRWPRAYKALVIYSVIFILVISVYLFYASNSYHVAVEYNTPKCKAQIASVSACYDGLTGKWKSDGCGLEGCLAADYGVDPKCLMDPGPLAGTPYWVEGSRFSCGPKID